MNAPKEDLIRSSPLAITRTDFRADDGDGDGDGDSGRTMVGYPIVFNQWTEIKSLWEGNFLERIAPQAVNRTLAHRRDRIVVAFNHGFDPVIGDKPLGKPERMDPDDFGLWTETPLSRTSYNNDLLELIRDGALWGQSFRFSVLNETWADEPDPSDLNPLGLPERTINELRLYEFGPVTYPAYEATTLGIRSRDAFDLYRRTKELPDPPAQSTGTRDTDGPPSAPVGAKARVARILRTTLPPLPTGDTV